MMDMLGNPKMRHTIMEYYQNSHDKGLVAEAIKQIAKRKENSLPLSTRVQQKKVREHLRHNITRMAVMEARAAKSVNVWILMFPLFIFFAFGFGLGKLTVLCYMCTLVRLMPRPLNSYGHDLYPFSCTHAMYTGTFYVQIEQALVVISAMCVFSTASALFMFPTMHHYYHQTLKVYGFERADGTGQAYDIVIQGFIRFLSIGFFPVIIGVTVLYFMVSDVLSLSLSQHNIMHMYMSNLKLHSWWMLSPMTLLPMSKYFWSTLLLSRVG